MINITLSLKDGTTISAMQPAKAAVALENTIKIFMNDPTRCDPEHFRQFADEIEKKAKELASLSREWADGLEAYREKAASVTPSDQELEQAARQAIRAEQIYQRVASEMKEAQSASEASCSDSSAPRQ